MSSAGEDNFLRKKSTTTIAFVVAVLLFLLPFVEIRCNGITVAQNTGIGLAFGSDYKLGGDMQTRKDWLDEKRGEEKGGPAKESGKVYAFALAALLLGVVGAAISFTNMKTGIANTVIGALAALSLIALMIQLNDDIKDRTGRDRNELVESVGITIAFTVWYYLSVISFFAAAFFSYRRGQLLATEGPPRQAPQLDLENPGEQSEFPKSASESELG